MMARKNTVLESQIDLDDICIQLLSEHEVTTSSSDHLSPQEKKKNPRYPTENRLGVEEGTLPRQRRIGVVAASDNIVAEQMRARALQKRFGEDLLSKMPGIFIKKL